MMRRNVLIVLVASLVLVLTPATACKGKSFDRFGQAARKVACHWRPDGGAGQPIRVLAGTTLSTGGKRGVKPTGVTGHATELRATGRRLVCKKKGRSYREVKYRSHPYGWQTGLIASRR